MEIIPAADPSALQMALAALKAGNVIIYPTDTLYGFGADAENAAAVAKVYELKQRSVKKDILIAVADLGMAERYCIIDDRAVALAKAFLPGPVSLVLPRSPGSPSPIGTDSSTIGIRVPNHPFALSLISALGKGITSTSVNLSSEPSRTDAGSISEQFSEALGLMVEDGLKDGPPSTVVDLTTAETIILREGVIPAAGILEVLG